MPDKESMLCCYAPAMSTDAGCPYDVSGKVDGVLITALLQELVV